MKISNLSGHPLSPPYWKFITVKRMKELLATLDDDLLLNAQSIGHTGNLGIYEDTTSSCVGILDIGNETITGMRRTEEKL